MDYEKAYKQLVEDFGIILNLNTVKESGVISVEDVRKLIPALTESEDERIRKELISFFKDRKSRLDRMQDIFDPSNFPCDDYSLCEKAISWLENKVEPKFKVGDWVVFNNTHDSIYQVEKIENYQYTIRHILGGSMPLSYSSENMLRRWTIQDAKDGDILFAKGSYFKEYAFIYSGMTEDNVLSTYCGFDLAHNNFDTKLTRFGRVKDFEIVCPATKKQRDTLMKAMADAGYTFDFEKKELKKIEQKLVSSDCDRAFKDFVKRWNEEGSDPHIKDVESTFSEKIMALIKENKALKDRYAWKPSEEHIHWLKWAINRMPDTEIANEAEAELRDLLEQLEKLMEE